MTAAPGVSIGLPVFNGEAYLAQTIESILAQDFEHLELIIGDNGSTDMTEEICRSATSDSRVTYDRSPVNRGASWNYNRLVGLAQADYFKWAAHDDVLAPTFLRRCVEELRAAPEAVLSYPRTILIDDVGNIIDGEFHDGLDLRDPDPVTRFRRYLTHPGEQHPVFGVIRKRCLARTGLIANCWGGDQVLLAELLLQGEFREVPERLFYRRYHAGTSLSANRTPAEVARWYDPDKRGRTALPRARLTVELAGVALSARLPMRTRARCLSAIFVDWIPRFHRVIAGEVKRTLTARLPIHAKHDSSNHAQGVSVSDTHTHRTMKPHSARDAARLIVPRSARTIARRAYWSARRWEERRPQELALKRLVAEHGDVVQAGPFAGMRSLTTMDDGCILPKLLGCYEEEIHSWIELIIARRPTRIIDVGCASGWYTTGFAYRLPDAEVFGYDLEPAALERARHLAEINGVADRVHLQLERLTARSLGAMVETSGTVIFMDIDGPEIEVLVPEEDPRLLDADILVEFHDHFDPAISRTIVERFQATHDIQRTFALGRDPAHYPSLDGLRTRWTREAAVAERRPVNPRQEFALMLKSER